MNLSIILTKIEYFKVLVKHFPKQTRKPVAWHFVIEDRFPDKMHHHYALPKDADDFIQKAREVFKDHPSFTDVSFYKVTDIMKWAEKELKLSSEAYDFMYNYKISPKIITPLFFLRNNGTTVMSKFLLFDDDVVVSQDPSDFYDKYDIVTGTVPFCDANNLKFTDVFNEIYSVNMTRKDFNYNNVSTVLMFTRKYFTDWVDIIKKTYNHPELLALYQKSKDKQFKYSTTRLHFMETAIYAGKFFSVNAPHYVNRVEVEHAFTGIQLEKLKRRKKPMPIFYHYTAGATKPDFVKFFLPEEAHLIDDYTPFKKKRRKKLDVKTINNISPMNLANTHVPKVRKSIPEILQLILEHVENIEGKLK